MDHLDQLENRSVHILREAYANFKNLGMLWSIGKDSTVLLWLARKAFFGHVPIPLIHIDTAYKIPEMIEYRDRLALEWNLTMIYGQNREALDAKQTYPDGAIDRIACCKALKTDALKHTLSGEWPRFRLNHAKKAYELDRNTEPFTGVIVGARADEEGSRSKERYFSPRTAQSQWEVGDQPPEFWNQYKTDLPPAPICGFTPCSTGPSSTSGNTSAGSRSRPSRSTTIRATASGSARWAATPAPIRWSPRPGTWTTSSWSCRPGSSPTSPSGRAGRRTRKAVVGWRRFGGTGTCKNCGSCAKGPSGWAALFLVL